MKHKYILQFLLLFCFTCLHAQITIIPDPAFEQALISFGIDSDGIVNGQVQSSDISNITELTIDPFNGGSTSINNITGIEDFASLEKLSISFSYITTLNVSQNTQLKILNCNNNMLTQIDVSNNTLLEKLDAGNNGGDVGPFNDITEIDLSNNPDINEVSAFDLHNLNIINLKNGNNEAMNLSIGFTVFEGPQPEEPLNTVCIKVDNEALAQSNQSPYSEWIIEDSFADYNFSETCALSTLEFPKSNDVILYPNPATDVLYLNSKAPVTEAAIYNLLGQKVKQLLAGSTIITVDVSSLTAGTYFIVVKTNTGSSTGKLVIK